MATETIDIRIREDGSRVVKRNLEEVGEAGVTAGKGTDILKKALAGLAVGAALVWLKNMADQYTNLTNRLKLYTNGAQNLKAVNDALFAASNRTRSSYSATVELYGSLARASKSLGLSQVDLLGITETVNKAIIISGTDAATAANGLRQLGQGLASGTLRGDELNSVLENMPRLASAIADGMGITVGQLRTMGAAGKITGKEITNALKGQAAAIGEEFTKMAPTIGGAIQVAQNHLLKFMATTQGVAGAVANAILFLTDHVDALAVAAVGLAGAFALNRAISEVQAFLGPMIALEKALGAATTQEALFSIVTKTAQGAMRGFTAALLENPFTALAVAATLAITAILMFGDKVKVTADGAITLKDAFMASLSLIMDGFRAAGAFIGGVWGSMVDFMKAHFSGFRDWTGDVLADIGNLFKIAVNAFIGVYVFAFKAIMAVWNNFPGAMNALFVSVVNLGEMAVELFVNSWQVGLHALSALIGTVAPEIAAKINDALGASKFSLPRMQANAAGTEFGQTLAAAASEAFGTDYVGKMGEAIINKARQLKAAAAGAGGVSGATTPAAATPETPAKGETRADFLAKVNRETDNSIKLAQQLGTEWRQVDNDMTGISEHLADKKWAELTKSETAALREKLKAMYDEIELQKVRDQILDQYEGPRKEYERHLQAVNQLHDAGKLSLSQYNLEMSQLGLQYAQLKLTMGDATWQDTMIAGIARVGQGFRGMTVELGQAWGDFFTKFADGFANSVGRAIVYGDNLKDSLLEVARGAVSELISALVKMGIQWVVNNTLGTTLAAASTAASAAMGVATAAAWAPAAAAVSLATMGANSVPAMAGMTSTFALSKGLSMLHFANGGYVSGPGGPRDDMIRAWLSNGEFVVNANATRDNLGLLQAMNSGAKFANGGMVGPSTGSTWTPPTSNDNAPSSGGATYEFHIDARGSDAGVEDRVRAVLAEEAPRLIGTARKLSAGDTKTALTRQRM